MFEQFKYRWWRTKEKRKRGGGKGKKSEALSVDWRSGFQPADFLRVQPIMAAAVAFGDFSARDQEDGEGGRLIERGGQPRHCSISLLMPCCPDPGRALNALGPPSWTPRTASSCWGEAPPPRTRSWGRSRRRRPTPPYLWSWCTACCQTTGSWPGAERSPSPSPGRGLKGTWTDEWKVSKRGWERHEGPVGAKYLAAPAARFAASGRRCPAGACGFSASYTGCTLWLCLRSGLEMPVCETFNGHLASCGFRNRNIKSIKTENQTSQEVEILKFVKKKIPKASETCHGPTLNYDYNLFTICRRQISQNYFRITNLDVLSFRLHQSWISTFRAHHSESFSITAVKTGREV